MSDFKDKVPTVFAIIGRKNQWLTQYTDFPEARKALKEIQKKDRRARIVPYIPALPAAPYIFIVKRKDFNVSVVARSLREALNALNKRSKIPAKLYVAMVVNVTDLFEKEIQAILASDLPIKYADELAEEQAQNVSQFWTDLNTVEKEFYVEEDSPAKFAKLKKLSSTSIPWRGLSDKSTQWLSSLGIEPADEPSFMGSRQSGGFRKPARPK